MTGFKFNYETTFKTFQQYSFHTGILNFTDEIGVIDKINEFSLKSSISRIRISSLTTLISTIVLKRY